jgi:hypothetical protein
LLATEWPEFCAIDLDRAGSTMVQRAIVDARNLLDPERVRQAGFVLERVGQPRRSARAPSVDPAPTPAVSPALAPPVGPALAPPVGPALAPSPITSEAAVVVA